MCKTRLPGGIWRSVLGFLLAAAINGGSLASSLPAGFLDTLIDRPDGQSWEGAAGIAFAPDGRAFVWERAGRVWEIAGTASRNTPLIDLSDEVSTVGALGLTGFALDPHFEANGYLYLFYAVEPQHLANCDVPRVGPPVCRASYRPGQHALSRPTIGRLVRYRLSDPVGAGQRRLDYSSRRVLLGETTTTGSSSGNCLVTGDAHGPGALAFGRDGTLLAACGDGASAGSEDMGSDPSTQYREALAAGLMAAAENVGAYRAQLTDSLSGKILRLDAATGAGIASNPFFDPAAARSARSRVWVLGLRDPQHFTVRPGSGSWLPMGGKPGTLYIGDQGYSQWESLAVATAGGANFGWPLYEGVGNDHTSFVSAAGHATDMPAARAAADEAFERTRPVIDWLHGGAQARWAGSDSTGEPLAVLLGTRAPNGVLVSGPMFGGTASVGGVWYEGADFPEGFRSVYFHADSGGEWIKAFVFDHNDRPVAVRDFMASAGPIRSLGVDPYASGLYYITGGRRSEVHRLSYGTADAREPVRPSTSALRVPGPVSAGASSLPAPAATTAMAPGPLTAARATTSPGAASARGQAATVPAAAQRSGPIIRFAQAASSTSGWSSQDIGSVLAAGSYSSSGGTFTVMGSGNDIWNKADAFQFVFQSLSGDGSITARVVSQTNTNSWAKAGVMFRETLAAGSSYAAMEVTPVEGSSLQARTATGISAVSTLGPFVKAPYWVRVVRAGNQFSGYASANGVTWKLVSQYTISMAAQVNVGLAVCSHANGSLSTVVFDNVTVTSSALPPPDTQPPTIPTGLTATTVTTSSVTLSWNASTDLPNPGGSGVGGYYIYRNGNTTTPVATVASGTTYTDSGLSAATAYSYQVAAFDLATPANVSAPSAAIGATTLVPDTQAPTVPTGLAVTGSTAASITLAWTPSTDLPNPGGMGVGGYYVYRNGNTATAIATVTAGSAFTDTGLTASTAYTYQVAAFDLATPANVSAPSGTVSATTQDVVGVAEVSNLVVNNGGQATYQVCGPGGTCGVGFIAGAALYVDNPSVTIAGAMPALVNGQTFIQTAQGDAAAGAGSSSFISFNVGQSATVYVAHDVQVTPPGWLTSNFMDTGISVTTNNGSSGSTLEIYSNVYPGGAQVLLGGNSASGATSSQSMYSVIVAPAATNAIAPNAPQSLGLIPNCQTAEVVGLTWSAAAVNPGGLPIAGYRIARNGAPIATVSYAQTSYQDTSVAQSSTYGYTVTAFDQAGNVSPPASVSATTGPASAMGDAPYCPSTLITGMSFDFLAAYSETNGNGNGSPTSVIDRPPFTDGSDLWPSTQAADGNTYAFFGDGWGVCGIQDTGSGESQDLTSFGFARLGAPPSGPGCLTGAANLYGGFSSASPFGGYSTCCSSNTGLILGKATGVLAIGNDFYAFGSAWRAADVNNWINAQFGNHPPFGTPQNHQEILSSTGAGNGGRQWMDSGTDLCTAGGSAANPVWGGALGVCPVGFIQFGAGYTGLPASLAGYVYVLAVPTQSFLVGTGPTGTYLLRVPITPTVQLLNPAAYQFFAGLDVNGNPIWSANGNQKQVIFNDPIDQNSRYVSADGTACAGQRILMSMSMGQMVYDQPLGRFIASAQGAHVGQVAFFEAPNPWGPWSVISYTNLSMSNIFASGWGAVGGGLGGGFCSAGTYINAISLGVHIANGFTDPTGTILELLFSSSGEAPASAGALGGFNANSNGFGNSMDSLNMVQATLTVGQGSQ